MRIADWYALENSTIVSLETDFLPLLTIIELHPDLAMEIISFDNGVVINSDGIAQARM